MVTIKSTLKASNTILDNNYRLYLTDGWNTATKSLRFCLKGVKFHIAGFPCGFDVVKASATCTRAPVILLIQLCGGCSIAHLFHG